MTGVELITLTGEEKERDTTLVPDFLMQGNNALYVIGAVCLLWFLYASTRKPL
jgi:hypothetical protein